MKINQIDFFGLGNSISRLEDSLVTLCALKEKANPEHDFIPCIELQTLSDEANNLLFSRLRYYIRKKSQGGDIVIHHEAIIEPMTREQIEMVHDAFICKLIEDYEGIKR